jgi:hypothetical protein
VNDRASNYITESSAAFADLGTFLPLMLGLVVVADMDPVGLLYGFGLFALFTAAVYRRPIPVQPMKAAAAMGIVGLISADVLVATAIMIGVVLIVLSQTQSIEWLKRLIPKTVLHGMKLALAVSLIITAVGMVDTHWFGAGIILCLLLAFQRTRLAGVSCALVLADPIAISKTRPSCQLLIICMVPVSLVYGLMVGLIFGILAEHLRIRFGPVAGSP